MKNLGDDLKATLLQFSSRERAELAHMLISSLDDTIDTDAKAEWDKELGERDRRREGARKAGLRSVGRDQREIQIKRRGYDVRLG